MPKIINYMFDNMSRLNEEDINSENIENVKTNSYMLNNFIKTCDNENCGCGCKQGNKCKKSPIVFGTSQPGIFFKSGCGPSSHGIDMDVNSMLSNVAITQNRKTAYHTQQRDYNTIPYLGKGPGNSMIESKLRNGEIINNSRASLAAVNELSQFDYSMTPLLPSIKEIMHPSNFVENKNAIEFLRGGIPTREMYRDTGLKS
jgi:hypothetical protein